MNSYSPGDPVWIIAGHDGRPAKIPATVTGINPCGLYIVDVAGDPCPPEIGDWTIKGADLRPRYDGDEKQTNFKLLEDLTGGWNPQHARNSNPLTERESEKEKSDAV